LVEHVVTLVHAWRITKKKKTHELVSQNLFSFLSKDHSRFTLLLAHLIREHPRSLAAHGWSVIQKSKIKLWYIHFLFLAKTAGEEALYCGYEDEKTSRKYTYCLVGVSIPNSIP
jgi:hypothetical protein